MIILKVIETILYSVLGVGLLTIIYNVITKIIAFIKAYICISIAIFLLIVLFVYLITWIIVTYKKSKPGRSLMIFIVIWSIVGYLYYAYLMDSPFPWGAIINTITPIQISNLGIDTTNNELTGRFKFPLIKSSFLRLQHDLPLKKNLSFPTFHYYVESDFYYYERTKIDRTRKFVCLFKNLGNESLIVREFKSIVIRRNGLVRFNGSYVDYPGSLNLVDELNKKIRGDYNALRPMILYPMEETELFTVELAATLDLLTIEMEIEYSEYNGNYPKDVNIHRYRQIDEVKFNSESPKVLSANTKYKSIIN